jgi:MFS family permease
MSGFCQNAWAMRRFMLIVFSYWGLQWTETDLAGSFFRTLVTCEEPVPLKGICPIGSFYEEGRCSPKPRGDVDWSGSANCFDKVYVLTKTTQFGGLFGAVLQVANILPSVFVANALLDKIGRKKVMLLSIAASVCALSFFALSCRFGNQLIVLGGFIGAVLNAFGPAQSAMSVDLAGKDESSRAERMAAVSAFQNLGVTAGFFAGFFALQANITDYFYVWATFAIAAFFLTLLCWLVLEESFVPEEGLAPFSCCKHGLVTCHDLVVSISQIKRDKFTFYACIPMFLSTFAVSGVIAVTGSWAIGICGFSQAVASLAGVLQPACISLSSMTISFSLRKCGAYNTCIFSSLVVAVGMVMCGLGGFAPELAGGLFWCGWATVGFGLGQLGPSFQALLSLRVPAEFQGRLAAVQALLGVLASASGSFFGSNVLFKLESGFSSGSRSISPGRLVLPWTFNASLCLASAFLMWCLRKKHRESSPLLVGEVHDDSFVNALSA